MRLIWRQSAREDLRATAAFIAERNVQAAIDLRDRVNSVAERLTEFPFMYRRGRIIGTREAVVHPNYILVYRVGADTVEVVNVLHTRREYPPG